MKMITSLTLSALLALFAFAGCASSSTSARNMSAPVAPAAPAAQAAGTVAGFAPDRVAAEKGEAVIAEDALYGDVEMPVPDGGIAGPSVNPVIDSRKIIKNVTMQLQTLTFDESVENIPRIVESFGGYVQDSYVEGRDMYNERGARSANFTIRIPAERLDSFTNSVGSEFHVISKSQNSQDITENYYDSKARLDALRVQEERLIEMLKQAAELEYLLQVEKELMNVRYEIESLTSALNRMDSSVSMSTVTIWLSEVVKYVPVENVPITFGERISRAFQESWKSFGEFSQNFAVWFVAAFPFLLLLAVIALIVLLPLRAAAKRRKAKKDKNTIPSASLSEPAAPAIETETQSPPKEG